MRSALRANRKICSAFYINLEIRSAFAQITRTNKTQIANHKTVLIENAITLRDEPHLLVIAHAHQIQRGHLAVAACAVTDGRHQAVFGWQVVCTNCWTTDGSDPRHATWLLLLLETVQGHPSSPSRDPWNPKEVQAYKVLFSFSWISLQPQLVEESI